MSSSLHRRYSGYLPPVIRGFWEYYHNCALEEGNSRRLLTSRAVNRESETHPPLRDRLLRLGRLENLSLVEPAFDLINTPKLVESVRNRDTVDWQIVGRISRSLRPVYVQFPGSALERSR